MHPRAVLPIVLTLLVACAVEKAPPAPPAEAPEPAELTIRTSDYTFTVPDTVAPGVTRIHLINDGQHEHHAILVRVDSGKTMADVAAALAPATPPPAWLVFVGGDGAAAPGQEVTTVSNLMPGLHVLICFLQDGPDQPLHLAQGMIRPFVVAGEPGLAVMPTATAEIQLVDFDFVLPTLTAGSQTLRVVNNGTQAHEIVLIRIPDGMTFETFQQELVTPGGPQVGELNGGNGGLTPGESNLLLTTLSPGTYAVVCFVPSPDDGIPHLMKGMIKPLTIPGATS